MQNEGGGGCLYDPPPPQIYTHTHHYHEIILQLRVPTPHSLYELRHYKSFWDFPCYKLNFFKVFRILPANKTLKAAIPRLDRTLTMETIKTGTTGLRVEGSRNLCGHISSVNSISVPRTFLLTFMRGYASFLYKPCCNRAIPGQYFSWFSF